MSNIDYRTAIMEYREKLITCGKRANIENPDNLSMDQLKALTVRIFSEIEKIDVEAFGFPPHDTGLRRPDSISEAEQHKLFMEFVDWYQIVKTLNQDIFDYVIKTYPVKNCPRILCVGDGENCHLGRKLAMEGYKVVSVDPVSRKEFSGSEKGKNGGSFRSLQTKFYKTSTDMINWADVIVGSKVPECVEDLIQVNNRPVVFNISNNVEIYHMRFRGKPITSTEQFVREIQKCDGVETKRGKDKENGEQAIFFVRDGRIKDFED